MTYIPVPVPVPTGVIKSAWSNGSSGLAGGRMLPYMTIPMVVGVGAALYAWRELRRTAAVRTAEVLKECNQAYCPPSAAQIHVDKKLNTDLLDQSMGAGLGVTRESPTLVGVWRRVNNDYFQQAASSPGVALVS
tara:strand:- start:516 stop:917 length:402 start_codon:yes stop_codon:yes gene_type:complete